MEQQRDNSTSSQPIQYTAIFAACQCGCNSSGWYVCGMNGWRSHYAVNAVAANLAMHMLNDGRITEDEVNVMWSLESDWGEVLVCPDDDAVIPPHLN